MRIWFAVDGVRDERALASLVSTIVGREFASSIVYWGMIRLPRAMRRGRNTLRTSRLRFSILQAKDDHADAVVAIVDTDDANPGDRLKELDAARQPFSALPTAIGEATPHFEAWLLDDRKAVCEALGLAADAEIPNPTKCNPKTELNRLCHSCPNRAPEHTVADMLAAIANHVQPSRCIHGRHTGFADFHADVTRVLGPLFR